MGTAGTLGPIVSVTVTVPDIRAAEQAYSAHLGYRTIARGHVSRELAARWGASTASGAAMLEMSPAAGDDFSFRFVERASAGAPYRAFSGHGWNAAEQIVANVDELAAQLVQSPFEIVAPPMDLSFCPDIRAMQIRGPGGEILYLTQFKKDVPGLAAPPARCAVDRTFIVIVGGRSLADMQAFYTNEFGVPEAPAVESRVQTMALEFGLSREHRFRIAALPLSGRCYIEADEMPAEARPLPEAADDLPPGIGIVSFAHDGRDGCLRGAAGERIELVRR